MGKGRSAGAESRPSGRAGQSVMGYGPTRNARRAVNNRSLRGIGREENRDGGSDEPGYKNAAARSVLWLRDLIIQDAANPCCQGRICKGFDNELDPAIEATVVDDRISCVAAGE